MCSSIPETSSSAFNPIHTLSTFSTGAIQLTRKVTAVAAFCLIHAVRLGILVGITKTTFNIITLNVPTPFFPLAALVAICVIIELVLSIQIRVLNPIFSNLAQATTQHILG